MSPRRCFVYEMQTKLWNMGSEAGFLEEAVGTILAKLPQDYVPLSVSIAASPQAGKWLITVLAMETQDEMPPVG